MKANPIEIMYNEFGENGVNVFHAMACQNCFLRLLDEKEVIMTEIEKETGMTDAECEYWDEFITKNPIKLGPDLVKHGIKPGIARHYLPLYELDLDVIEYLRKQAAISHKSQIQIINDLVREKLAISV